MKGTIMFFRSIGKLYFWLVFVPSVHRWVTPVLIDVGTDFVNKKLDDLSPEDKARLERARARRSCKQS
jgi:hypothetical protein